MFKIWKRHSINQINIIAILFAGIFAGASAFVVIFNEYLGFQKDLIATEKSYIQNQKRKVFEQSGRLYRLIEYRHSKYNGQNLNLEKESIAREVSIVLDDSSDGGYLFIYCKDMEVIYKSKELLLERETVQRIFDASKNGGRFLEFDVEKDDELMKNIAYIRELEELGWIIGSSIGIGDKDLVLAQRTEEHYNKITSFMLKIITLTLFLYLASILKYRYITEKLSKEIKFIVNSLKDASKNYTTIDRSKVKFEEFREITSQVNNMLESLKQKRGALEDLNLNLESLVKEKTKELQKSVEYASELLQYQDKFLKNSVHEINTPLSIILMNIELYNLKFERNPYLIKIEAAVKVIENIYGDLSFIVKKESQNKSVDMVNFSDFIDDRIEYFSDVALGNKIDMKSEVDRDIFVLFNESELQRLCDNNISNAIKYSHINKTVHVRLYTQDNCTVFEVENFGDSIVDKENIFSRYYREDKSRGGFGLGLNIVKDICESNDVRVEVKSDEKHTVFRYFFECSRRVV